MHLITNYIPTHRFTHPPRMHLAICSMKSTVIALAFTSTPLADVYARVLYLSD